MTNSDDRLIRLENQAIDLRVAVSAMLETVVLHQRNFETIQRNFETMQQEIRDLRQDMLQIQAESRQIQSEIRGLQTENRRILERLEGQQDNSNE